MPTLPERPAEPDVPAEPSAADGAAGRGGPRADAAFRAQVAARLAAWPVWAVPPAVPADAATQSPRHTALAQAAVALAIADEGGGADLPGLPKPPGWSGRAALLLTRRAAHLNRHAGQWALPGGRLDEGETAEQAALRELAEELGLHLQPADVLGRLDTFVTRSGFAIVPVVVWAGVARTLVPAPAEVASVHRIPVAEFLRPDAPILEPLAGSAHPVLKLPVGHSWIAAPTAALLYQFTEVCVRGRDTRVAHFEQPRFAWA